MKTLSKIQLHVLERMENGAVLMDGVSQKKLRAAYLVEQEIISEAVNRTTVDVLLRCGSIRFIPEHSRYELLPIDRAEGVTRPCIIRWDSSEYWHTDEEYLKLRGDEDDHVEELDEDGEPTEAEEEWREDILNHKDIWEQEEQDFGWEDTLNDLNDLMEVFPSAFLKAHVSNFGWRNQDGYKNFRASAGDELLREILPNTDCTWEVYYYTEPRTGRKGLALQNWHHDSPMGGEWYYITERGDEDAE